MTHRQKIDRLIPELKAQGVGKNWSAPPLFRMLWALGIEIPPPLFMDFFSLAVVIAMTFFFPMSALFWFVLPADVWAAVRADMLCTGAILGIVVGLVGSWNFRRKAKKLRLPSWENYGGGYEPLVSEIAIDREQRSAPQGKIEVKPRRAAALRLMALVVIGGFATALYMTICLQEWISITWKGWAAEPPSLGYAGWPTIAILTAMVSLASLWAGYQLADSTDTRERLSGNAPVIASAACAILGVILYSRMAPVSDIRIPDDLKWRTPQWVLAFTPELLAQFIAQMGVGAIVKSLFEAEDPLNGNQDSQDSDSEQSPGN